MLISSTLDLAKAKSTILTYRHNQVEADSLSPS